MSLSHTTNAWKAYGFALQGAFLGLILVLIACTSVRYGRFDFSFALLPIAAIYVWPEQASETVSSILIFLLGFLQDMISGGPLGLSAILYLSCFALLRTAYQNRRMSLRSHFGRFFFWVVSVTLFLLLMGFVAIQGSTDTLALLLQAVTVLLAFPVFMLITSTFTRPDGSFKGLFDA